MSREAATGAVHPRIDELLELLAETRASLTMAVAQVPPDRREVRLADGRWTVGEILDHLHRIDAGFARRLQKIVAEAKERGTPAERESSSILDRLDPKLVLDRSRRLEAPELVRPTPEARASDALAALAESRAAVCAALTAASGLALGTITFQHSVLGTLDMYQATIFLGLHEERHAEQIREIARAGRA